MSVRRYWRATLLRAYDLGPHVELTEFWLMVNETRVDFPATLSSNLAPISGSVSDLKDGSLASSVTFPVGTTLTWDFGGSPVGVTDIRLGSADQPSKFLLCAAIESSDDAVSWSPELSTPWIHSYGYKWPGPRALTSSSRTIGWTYELGQNFTIDSVDPTILVSSTACRARAKARQNDGVRQFEITSTHWRTAAGNLSFGVVRHSATNVTSNDDWTYRPKDGLKSSLGSTLSSYTTGLADSTSDVLGVVVDFPAGTLTYYLNGVSRGVAFTTLSGEMVRPYCYAPGAFTTITLRTSDFAYPIPGAEAWDDPQITSAYYTPQPEKAFIQGIGGLVGLGPLTWHVSPRGRADFTYSRAARGRIAATVKRKDTPVNVPLVRKVFLYRDSDGMLIRETWSDSQGNYQFDYIEEWEAYTVISFDHTRNHRAVAADNLTLANGGITLIP